MPPYVMDDDDLARVCAADGRGGAGRMIITGTDTGVGKTVVSRRRCAITSWPYVKAVQTGDDDDAAEVARLAGVETRCPRPLR